MKESSGFTLLEVMIAVSIIGLVLVALLRMQAGTLSLARVNAFNQNAPLLAEQLLSEVEGRLTDWTDTEGEFDAPHKGVFWSCDIQAGLPGGIDGVADDLSDRLNKIEIRITTEGGRSFSLNTWRLADE